MTTANEIHIPVGRPVDLELQSRDVIHSFWVPQLHGKVDLVPGQINRIRLQADRAGVYQGACAEFCGVQHAHMRLELVAEPPAQYQMWLARERAPAGSPTGEAAERGQQLFMTAPCVGCHTVRGSAALGRLGPDLTHLASRRTLAAGTLSNNAANLEAWITHPQGLKPGVRMPDNFQLTGAERAALVAYLQELRLAGWRLSVMQTEERHAG